MQKKENIASKLIVEDHLKNLLSITENKSYKPWKNDFCPKNPQSPFGDFPREYQIKKKIIPKRVEPIHELSQAATTLSKFSQISVK